MTDPSAARLAHPDGSSSDDTTRSRTAHHLVDIDEARLVGSRLYYPQKLTVLDHAPAFTMSVQAARIGSVLLGELRYDADVRIDCGELGDSYHVNVPLHGRLASRHDGQESVASPGHAALYGPLGETVLTRWEAGSRQLCVKIDRAAFETTLSRHVGRDIVGPISVEPVLDVGGGAGRSWVELALMLNEQLHRPDSIVHQPLVAGSLANGLLSGLITAAGLEHRVQDAVRSSPTVRPRTIELALAYLNEHAGGSDRHRGRRGTQLRECSNVAGGVCAVCRSVPPDAVPTIRPAPPRPRGTARRQSVRHHCRLDRAQLGGLQPPRPVRRDS